jgi:hypothetical protein
LTREYEKFLYAAICEGVDRMPLKVLSAIARQNLGLLVEAVVLARLSKGIGYCETHVGDRRGNLELQFSNGPRSERSSTSFSAAALEHHSGFQRCLNRSIPVVSLPSLCPFVDHPLSCPIRTFDSVIDTISEN